MKKKFLSSLLFAALVGGAVSTFTACKDYDDDINNIQKQVDQLEALKATQTAVDEAIKNLKSQLEAADAQLKTALESQIGDKADKTALAALEGRVATLETKVATLEGLKSELTEMINKKADKEYVDGLYAGLITVDGKLGEKLLPLVQNEVDALKNGAVKNLDMQLEAISKMTTAEGVSPLVDAINALKANIGETDIQQLAVDMQNLSIEIDKYNAELNLLTVLCKQGLRSLVFQPKAYYWGVEATRLFTLDNKKYTLGGTDWDKFETKSLAYNDVNDYGYKEYNRWPSKDFFKVLDFQAVYHMNPSTAELDKAKNHDVTVTSEDKEFITRATTAAGLGVDSWKTENGNLIVNLSVENKNEIKTIADNQQITVFAAQAHIGDTVITSDYATIVKKNINDVKIYHKVADVAKAKGQYGTYTQAITVHPITKQPVDAKNGQVLHNPANNTIACPSAPAASTGIPEWNEEITEGVKTRSLTALTPSTTLGPVLGTVKQSFDYFAQDWVLYDCEGFDLKELVCVRVWDGETPIEVDPAELGLKYKFELTALHVLDGKMVGNDAAAKTSESAHACLNGDIFRPQMVTKDGKQAEFGAAQDKQEIGRTPVVRVSLVDDEGNVYDYGYIRLLIVDKEIAEIPAEPTKVEYTGDDWSYGYECEANSFTWENNWSMVEYDLYNLVGLTRDEFVTNYYNATLGTDGPVLKTGSSVEFQQYVKGADGQFTELADNKFVGVVTQTSGLSSTGEETSTLKWYVSGDQALKNFKKDSKPEIAVKYRSLDSKYPDIYVVMKPGNITIYDAPVANISWDALKNPSYWYANNSNVSINGGTAVADAVEMHNNVLTPEDNTDGTLARNFRQTVSATMLNNTISGAKLFVDWATAPAKQAAADYKAANFKGDLVFSAKNEDKVYNGESGVSYKMTVSADGKTLKAYKTTEAKINAKPVAQIVGTTLDAQKIVYGGNTVDAKAPTNPYDFKAYLSADATAWDYAKDLLNYKAHDALDDNTIRAIVGINLTNGCDMEVKHNDATIDVRFLRPINVANNAKEIEDANTTEVQVVKITDLVSFTDWRDAWKKDSYPAYYGIKSISIDELENDGDKLSANEKVLTNQSGKVESLSKVNAALDFIYTAPAAGEIAGTLTYKNYSSTVDQFYVEIPLTVEYFWGYIHTSATVTVKRTAHNAPER